MDPIEAKKQEEPANALALPTLQGPEQQKNMREYLMSIRLRFITQNEHFDSRQFNMEVPIIADASLDEVAEKLSRALYDGWQEFQCENPKPNQSEEQSQWPSNTI